jgi:chemotaxis signal transduction protein
MMDVTPAPEPRPGLAGTVNLHGSIVAVWSLRELSGGVERQPRLSDLLILADDGRGSTALWADETRGVIDIRVPRHAGAGAGSSTVPQCLTITENGTVVITDLAGFLGGEGSAPVPDALRALRVMSTARDAPVPGEGEPDPRAVRAVLRDRAARMVRPDPGTGSETLTEILRFQLAYRQYAIEMAYVREVILTGEITPVPGTPEFIAGICAVRGQIISLVDLRSLFKVPERGLTDLNRVIVLTDGKLTFGILADTISGVGTIPLDRVQPPDTSDLPEAHRYLMGRFGSDLLVIDATAILGDPAIIVDDA